MKNLKLGLLAFGLLGLVGCFLPMVTAGGHSFSLWSQHTVAPEHGGGVHVYMVMGGYAAGFLMGLLAVIMPPAQRWQALVALIGFALVLAKLRNSLPLDIFKDAIGGKLMGAAAYGGALCSLLGLVLTEKAR